MQHYAGYATQITGKDERHTHVQLTQYYTIIS